MGHPWLLDDSDPIVQTVMPDNLNGSKVSGLIDMDIQTWDLPLLRIFYF